MKKLTHILLLCLVAIPVLGQTDWTIDYKKQRIFVENIGQFDFDANEKTGNILYVADLRNMRILFGEKGVRYLLKKVKFTPKAEREALMQQEVDSHSQYKSREKLYGKYFVQEDEVNMKWSDVSPNMELIAAGQLEGTHGYCVNDPNGGEMLNFNGVRAFEKLRYENILNNIDIEYEIHPTSGVKYTIFVRPGANPSDIRMIYDENVALMNNELHIPTLFGDIIDHEPTAYYESNPGVDVPIQFKQVGNEISFDVPSYNSTETLVIDPWVQNPNDPSSNWDCVWELDYDNSGNVYVIAGIMPMQLIKYNAAGALQWTHNTPYDTTAWLGTMATDNNGNSYVTNGTYYAIQKIDVNGNLVWNNGSPSGPGVGLSTEFWNISFNCDQSKLLIGGSGGGFNIHGRVYDVDMNTGDVNTSMMVTFPGGMFSIPVAIQEIRAMCPSPSGKYYFVSLDTIGYLSDNLDFCSGLGSSLVKDANGIGWGYKAENWRYNNTGIKVIRADANAVYINRGNILQKRSLVDFSVLATTNIPNGNLQGVFLGGNQTHNAGLDIDNCGNVYAGSTDGVYKYDANLNQLAFYATPAFKVWDCRVTALGDLIACGGTGTSSTGSRTGGVALFNGVACSPVPLTCCNANFCNPGPLCENDPFVNLSAEVGGGTWSGTGIVDPVNGVFDPATAGVGNHLITYTLACGSSSMIISVIACNAPITVCEEGNGDLTATGGSGTYTWYEATLQPVSQPIGNEQECIDCPTASPSYFFGIYTGCSQSTCTYTDTVWVQYATGSTTSPPSSYPILIVDGAGDSLTIQSGAGLAACVPPPLAVNIKDESVSCLGAKTQLQWTTINENNSSKFEIYRSSADGEFRLIGELAAAGYSNSEIQYVFTDEHIQNGNSYYRVYEVDNEGKREMLFTRTSNCTNDEVKIYPNPFNDELKIRLGDLLINADGILRLYTYNGQLIDEMAIPRNTSFFEYDTQGLHKGVYIIKIESNNASHIEKVIKRY